MSLSMKDWHGPPAPNKWAQFSYAEKVRLLARLSGVAEEHWLGTPEFAVNAELKRLDYRIKKKAKGANSED